MLDGKTLWVLLAAAGIVAGLCGYMVSNARSIRRLDERLRRIRKDTDKKAKK